MTIWNPTGIYKLEGTPAFKVLTQAGTSGPGAYGQRVDLPAVFSQWALRVKVTGGTTEAIVNLYGMLDASTNVGSTSVAGMVALSTYQLSAGSCDQTVWVTGKPVNAIIAQLTTMGLSTGAYVDAWAAGVS